jgi:predicted phage tail protein
MVTLVLVKNPFSPQDGREVKQIEAGKTLAELIQENAIEGVELQATVNGCSYEDKEIKDGDFVVIYPVIAKGGGKGGKGILGIVFAVALSVVSFGVGGLVGAGAWGASMASWGVMGYIAAAAVMFLGSSLIGRGMAGQQIDNGSYDSSTDDSTPTYSWGGVQTMEGQNNPVALTYGKVKSGGQTIGKFVSIQGEDEYLNWLVACGEGPLSITDIRLNNNDIAIYSGTEYTIRTGENDQSIIPYFGDTYFTKSLSYHMTQKDTWYSSFAEGTATEGLIFKIECPNGLYHVTDQGKLESNSIDIELEYRVRGNSGWYRFGGEHITGNSRTAIRKEYRADKLIAREYETRVRVVRIEHEESGRDCYEAYWTAITSIVYDDFTYPCTALIGIRAKATDQLSGNPTLTFMKERSTVWVWNGSAYVEKPANNPAWACYDLLHQARRLKNTHTGQYEFEVRGAAKEVMRYEDFNAWANFCVSKQLYVNIEINGSGEVLEVANTKIAPIGRGLVVRFGTRYGCIYDHVQAPVQMFGMGNIISGTFNEEFMKVADRANCVEITFTNKDAAYERDVLTIYGDTFDTDGYAKTAQMTFDGIVDYEQAYREGMYQLYSNKYLLRTVSFEADIDSIACTVGDVVLVSHDVPKWANSGRIEAINGTTWTLPVELEDTTSAYHIQWRTVNDTLYVRDCTIVSSADGWTVVTVQGEIPVDDPPQAGDVFDIALANVDSKPFVIKSITRAQDFRRRISCIEYNENIYNENYDIPPIDYTERYGEPQNVTNLIAENAQLKNAFGENVGRLRCSWNIPDNGGTFTVLTSTDNAFWEVAKSNIATNNCELNVLPGTIYYVKVITTVRMNQSTGTVIGPLYPTGDGALPQATNLKGVTVYRGVINGENRYEIHLTWDAPILSNYKNCDVYYKTDHAQVRDLSMTDSFVSESGYENEWKYAGSGYNDFTLSDVTNGDTYKFAVVTNDLAGNSNLPDYSPYVFVVATTRTEKPNTPDGFSITFGQSAEVSWKEVSNADILYYEIRTDQNCGTEDNHLLIRTNGTSAVVSLNNRTGTLYLYARSTISKYSYPAVLNYNKSAPPKPNAPVLTDKLGGFSLVANDIPAGCNGLNIYIDGTTLVSVHTVNNTYTHSCGAGVYTVSIAYTDIFGEGAKSNTSAVTVKVTVDSSLLDAQAVTKEKLSTALQDTVDAVGTNTSNISALATRMTTAEGNIVNDGLAITQNTNDISSLATRVTTAEGTITTQGTEISQNANDISAVAARVTTAEGTITTQGTSITQNANDISAVATRMTTAEGNISTNTTNITQNANSISAVVTNLNEQDPSQTGYTAITALSNGIASKVSMGDVTSYFQQDHTGFYIKGSLINIDGDTVINAAASNAIVNAIQAGSITADKLSIGTGPNTARMVLSTNLLSIYDANGTLRVRMGVWEDGN